MAAGVLTLGTFNPYKENAYSEAVKFDLEPLARGELRKRTATDPNEENNVCLCPEVSLKTAPSRQWRTDVTSLASTRTWLKSYGLARNKLDMFNLLPKLGFRHSDDYDDSLKKPICSRYGDDLFKRYFRSDGRSYNLSCSLTQLQQTEVRLSQAVALYRRRLDWLTSESRRLFGVIQEKTVAIVIDIRCLSPQRFDQYRCALERVIREQLTRVARFNIIRSCEDLVQLSRECVPVTAESIENAVRWVWSLDRCAAIAPSSTCEAVMKAIADKHMEAVYLFTEGSSSQGSGEILREKLTGVGIPVHVVSYNCSEVDVIRFLKQLALVTGGRFHAYAVTMEMDSYEREPISVDTHQANVVTRRKTYGGVPAGAGTRPDVIELFEELEEAKSILAQIQALIVDYPKHRMETAPSSWSPKQRTPVDNETYMSSADWLTRYGLKARRLGFYDILSGVAFRHRDGVVQLMSAPDDENVQTDANLQRKLVNARYCDRFAHVRWKDGEVAHVHVTPEVQRSYERNVTLAIDAMQQRIDWLQQGSRELFGTIVEDRIYFLIDTSASMAPHMQFVKDKMFVLMQEQLRHKQAFNILAFSSAVLQWRDALTSVSEKSLRQAWHWLRDLNCHGSTNTLAALHRALADPQTQAIYLLTDGRPDQAPESVLSQMQLHRPVPIHAISFNCSDRTANDFLCKLARLTKGRFHFYAEQGCIENGPEPWESEDIRLLRQEIRAGRRNLEKIAMLREECAALSWSTREEGDKYCSRDHPLPDRGRDSAVPSLNPSELYRPDHTLQPERPSTAPGSRRVFPSPGRSPRPATSLGLHPQSSGQKPQLSHSLSDAKPVFGGHNRSSILRTLSINNSLAWHLPETRALFDRQAERQGKTENEPNKKSGRKLKLRASTKPMSTKMWLSRHGLAARKLTIVDALSSTFIPHQPKYIPILKKSVVSKVFDQVLPIAHETGDKTHIVNPQAVDLKSYITKVENAIEKIDRRLNCMIWEALPEEERKTFDATTPVRFIYHKVALLSALERSGWPVSERDVLAMENEIHLGRTYVTQAQQLLDNRTTQQGKKINDDGSDDDDEDVDAEETKKAASRKQFEGLGQALKKKRKVTCKKTESTLTQHKVKKSLDSLRGQKVISRNEVDGFYYPGQVIRCPDSRHALVEFNEIGQQTVPTRFVILTSGAVSRPPINIGDCILAKVTNMDTGIECYVPGIVQMTPQSDAHQLKFYTAILYTKQKAELLRSFIVKISKMRYNFLVRYISERSRGDEDEDKEKSPLLEHSDKESERSSVRSRSRSGSKSRSRSRSVSPTMEKTGASKAQARLERWQRHLAKQQKKQERQQKKLRHQAKKLSQLKHQFREFSSERSTDQQKLLALILDEIKKKKASRRPSPRSRSRVRSPDEKTPRDKRGEHEVSQILTGEEKEVDASGSDEEAVPFAMKMRTMLPALETGEEVLSRWSDDGWYYRGTVRHDCGDSSYLIEDSVGDLEKIWREDVIADSDDANVVIQPKDPVIAMHPSYTFSYAPAVVLEVTSDLWFLVRFYDDAEARLPRDEVYRTAAEKFETDVSYIVQLENRWIGQAVVARNDDTGAFQLGSIRERLDSGVKYSIEWSDGSTASQKPTFIFGAFTKRHPLSVGDHVIAMAGGHDFLYLPGVITSIHEDESISVKFCDGSLSTGIDPVQSFWLSHAYYIDAVRYYSDRQAAPPTQRKHRHDDVISEEGSDISV